MNLGKLSGLKGLVSHSQGKRRFRGDLTPEMISPPLGDFRHTMHVGRGGDVFGDTSFLSNHGGTGGNVDADSASNSDKSEGFFSRTLRHMRKTPERPRGGSKDLSPPPPPVSPIIKNAISLPRLDVDSPNGCPVKVLFPSSPKPQEDSCSYGVESGFLTLPRLSRTERQPPANSSVCSLEVCRGSLTDPGLLSTPLNHSDSLSRSDSMTSFTVDLGPSLMSEVFGMIDSPKGQQESSISLDFANDKPELDPITPTLVNSFLREDYNGKRGLYGAGLEEDMAECEHSMRSTADLLLRSLIDEEEGNGVQTVQRAACVQAHPSGSGGLRLSHTSTPPMGNASFAFPEEEEEIKV